MFEGFSDKTFEFFMAIRYNNNREFFHDNHDWYADNVRKPMLALCRDLSEAMYEIDPLLETRPEKCVCRINRDIRFSKDKAPYRDYSFFSFRRPNGESSSTLGFYFQMSDSDASWGMGYYDKNMAMMNAFRTLITNAPYEAIEYVSQAMSEFRLVGNVIKRMAVPDSIPEILKPWYPLRGFYVEKELKEHELLKSPELVETIKKDYSAAAGLYKALTALDN